MTSLGFDIVTVVFRNEITLLRLQARSLARYFEAGAVNSILVIVNDRLEDECVAAVQAMAGDYGALQPKMRILRPDDLRDGLPQTLLQQIERSFVTHIAGLLKNANPWRKAKSAGWRGNKGWRMQQAFKLMSVQACTGSHVLILDAKNHFIAGVGPSDLVSADGRALTRAMVPHPLQKQWLVASFNRLGYPVDLACGKSVPTVTPMVIDRAVFELAVRLMRDRLGPLDLLFAWRRKKCTEFMLLFAAVDQGTGAWWQTFAEGLFVSVTLFSHSGLDNIPGVIAKARADQARMFGLHRNAMLAAPAEAQRALFEFWTERGILHNVAEGASLFGPGASPDLARG